MRAIVASTTRQCGRCERTDALLLTNRPVHPESGGQAATSRRARTIAGSTAFGPDTVRDGLEDILSGRSPCSDRGRSDRGCADRGCQGCGCPGGGCLSCGSQSITARVCCGDPATRSRVCSDTYPGKSSAAFPSTGVAGRRDRSRGTSSAAPGRIGCRRVCRWRR